jgi:hypothetical protein
VNYINNTDNTGRTGQGGRTDRGGNIPPHCPSSHRPIVHADSPLIANVLVSNTARADTFCGVSGEDTFLTAAAGATDHPRKDCFVGLATENPGPANTAGTLVPGAKSHCNVEFAKKGRQTARTFVTAGIADPTPGCAGAKRIPFYGRLKERGIVSPTATKGNGTNLVPLSDTTNGTNGSADLIDRVTANPVGMNQYTEGHNNIMIQTQGTSSTYGSADPTGNMMKPVESPREASADLGVTSNSEIGKSCNRSAGLGKSSAPRRADLESLAGRSASDIDYRIADLGIVDRPCSWIVDNPGRPIHNPKATLRHNFTIGVALTLLYSQARAVHGHGGSRCLTQQN